MPDIESVGGDDLRGKRLWDALDAWAAALEPPVAKALREAIEQLKSELTISDLERIVASGDVQALLSRVDWEAVQHALRDVATRTADQMAIGFPTGGMLASGAPARTGMMPDRYRVRFNILDQHAVDGLRTMESRAIEQLRGDVAAGVIEQLQVGLERGWNPRQTAITLRDTFGLPAKDVRANANFQRMLETLDRSALDRALRDKRGDAAIRAAIDAGNPLSKDFIATQVERHRAKALRVNSETIARTASMDAVNTGQALAWDQAVSDGLVDQSIMRRFWIVARDERLCQLCRPVPALNPEGRGMYEPFITPIGSVDRPTLHWRCRCIVFYKIVEFAYSVADFLPLMRTR